MATTMPSGAKKIDSTDNWRDIFDCHNDTCDAVDALNTAIVNTNSKTIYNSTALSQIGTVLQYLNSLPGGARAYVHTWAVVSDMPSDLSDTLYGFQFVTDAGNRNYDYVILTKVETGEQWFGKTSSNNLTTRTLSWIKQPSRTEVDALNSKLTPSSVSFTYASGVTSQTLFIRKSGNVVTVNGFVKFSSAPTVQTEIGTFAAGNRPDEAVRTNAVMAEQAYAVGENAYFTIGYDGVMRVTPKSGNAYTAMYVSCSYIAQR